ncbi:MAG: panthothenate synthetase [Deltaproteobacteria bacterium]|nr:panthothenate synthetase [Deltaproteobacteria bacterium]
MRMLMNVRIPHEPFNTLTKEGKSGEILQNIIQELKPEFIFFTEQGGTRGAVAIIDVNHPSEIPFFSEPFFLNFNADCEFRVAMSPEDLGRAGLENLGKKWA